MFSAKKAKTKESCNDLLKFMFAVLSDFGGYKDAPEQTLGRMKFNFRAKVVNHKEQITRMLFFLERKRRRYAHKMRQ